MGVGENMIPGAGGGGGALDWLCSGRLNQADPNGANQTWFLEGPVGAWMVLESPPTDPGHIGLISL